MYEDDSLGDVELTNRNARDRALNDIKINVGKLMQDEDVLNIGKNKTVDVGATGDVRKLIRGRRKLRRHPDDGSALETKFKNSEMTHKKSSILAAPLSTRKAVLVPSDRLNVEVNQNALEIYTNAANQLDNTAAKFNDSNLLFGTPDNSELSLKQQSKTEDPRLFLRPKPPPLEKKLSKKQENFTLNPLRIEQLVQVQTEQSKLTDEGPQPLTQLQDKDKSTEMYLQSLIYDTSFTEFSKLGDLSVRELDNHIRQNHPAKSNTEKWPLLESTGSLFSWGKRDEPPDFLKDIGIGASLFLVTIKSHAVFFLFLSLLQIPALWIFASGTESQLGSTSIIGWAFGNVNIGNIGQTGPICFSQDLSSNENNINLMCHTGTMNRIIGIGINKYEGQLCNQIMMNKTTTLEMFENNSYNLYSGEAEVPNGKIFSTYIEMQQECSTYLKEEMKNSLFVQQIVKQFEAECQGQEQCTLNHNIDLLPDECSNIVKYRAFNSINQALWESLVAKNSGIRPYFYRPRDSPASSPVFFIQIECESIDTNLIGIETPFPKSTIALVLTLVDILCVTALLIYSFLVPWMQQDFANAFDKSAVEARDYTFVIQGLTPDYEIYRDVQDLQFAIWHDINEACNACVAFGITPSRPDSTIISQQFICADTAEFESLKQIMDQCEELERQYVYIKAIAEKVNYDDTLINQKDLQIMQKACKDLKDIVQKYGRKFHNSQAKNIDGQHNSDDSDYEMNRDQEFIEKVQFIFVVFKSQETKELLEKLYNLPEEPIKDEKKPLTKIQKWQKHMKEYKLHHLYKETKEQKKRTRKKKYKFQKLFTKFARANATKPILKVQPTIDPEFILWGNLTQSIAIVKSKQIVSLIITVFCLIITLFILRGINDWQKIELSKILKVMGEKGSRGVICGTMQITKEEAYVSHIQSLKRQWKESKQTTKLYCYCQNAMFDSFFSFLEPFDDGKTYCYDWLLDFIFVQCIEAMPSTFLQVINVLLVFIFNLLVEYEGHSTTSDLNYSEFMLIFLQHFISYGFISVWFMRSEVNISFDPVWYMTIGSSICLQVILSMVSAEIPSFIKVMTAFTKRCRDRSCQRKNRVENPNYLKYNQKKDGEDQNEIQDSQVEEEQFFVKSKKLRQKDLNDLYTGCQLDSGEKFAELYTIFNIALTYSFGLPAVYAFSMMFFFSQFWINKIMLMRFHQRTYQFNEGLPIKTSSIMKVGIFMHLVFSNLQLSNQNMLAIEEKSEEHFEYMLYGHTHSFEWSIHLIIYVAFSGLIVLVMFVDQFIFNLGERVSGCIVRCVNRRCIKQNKQRTEDNDANDNLLNEVPMETLEEKIKNKLFNKIGNIASNSKQKIGVKENRSRLQQHVNEKEDYSREGGEGENNKRVSFVPREESITAQFEHELNSISPLSSRIPLSPKKANAMLGMSKDHKIGSLTLKKLKSSRRKSEESDDQVEDKFGSVLAGNSIVYSQLGSDSPLNRKSLKTKIAQVIEHENLKVTLKKRGIVLQDQEEVKEAVDVVSVNFIADILTDYLDVIYKQTLLREAETRERLKRIMQRAQNQRIPQKSADMFQQYAQSITKVRQMMENQVLQYHTLCELIEREEQKQLKRGTGHVKTMENYSREMPDPQLDPVTNEYDPADIIRLFTHLNSRLDEDEMQRKYIPENFRCISLIQSYYQVHSKEFYMCNLACLRAKKLLETFISLVSKIKNKPEEEEGEVEEDESISVENMSDGDQSLDR